MMLVQVGTAGFILATLSGSRGFIVLSLAGLMGAFTNSPNACESQ